MKKYDKHIFLIKLFNQLKKNFPLKHKIIYRTKKFHLCGECSFDDKKNIFLITIDNNTNIQTQVDSMLHEYAHALRMNINLNNIEHDIQWGKEYSKVWKCFEQI